jgi:hypothetical protein
MLENLHPDPDERVAKNMAEGRGFRLMEKVKTGAEGEILSLQVLTNFGELRWM